MGEGETDREGREENRVTTKGSGRERGQGERREREEERKRRMSVPCSIALLPTPRGPRVVVRSPIRPAYGCTACVSAASPAFSRTAHKLLAAAK